jgi:hypothetical protein
LTIGFGQSQPEGKNQNKYLPLLYRGLRYPRLARNTLENREQVARQLHSHSSWNTRAALSTYRTFRPRFLNYLVEVVRDGRKIYKSERRPVGPDDLTPFVLVAWSSEHYHIDGDDEGDLEALFAVAANAAVQYFDPLPDDLQQNPRAFWVSANCLPPGEIADEDGNIRIVEGLEKEVLANQDVSHPG